ncbi:hypothetical protein AC249_AIPGENE12282 [Exaiptasia diaphana]|nr:hypothetical protein AC249_AIPGENE12282 [Exaiptasia diaphana]
MFCISTLAGLNVLAHWSLNGSETGLTLHGGPTFVEGRLPGTKAIAFTKINSYARIPRVSLQHRSFTIAVWIKVYSILSRPQHFVSDWYSPYNFYFGILQNNGNLIFSRHTQNGDWPSVKTSFSITPKNWQHVAVTWNSTNLEYKLYLNGTEVYSKILSSDKTRWRSERSTFELGDSKHSLESQFLGELMDLYIIDGTVNTEQINFIKEYKH